MSIKIFDKQINTIYEDAKYFKFHAAHEKNKENEKLSNICTVHNQTMTKKRINILYGLPASGPIAGYEEEREKSFPNCDDFSLGGCEVTNESSKYTLEYVCEYCNKVRDEWKLIYKSAMYFWLNIDIKDNIIIFLNNKYKCIIEKEFQRHNYWIKDFPVPNGKYKITAKIKNTNIMFAEIETELDNENLILHLEKENEDYFFKIDKYKSDPLW